MSDIKQQEEIEKVIEEITDAHENAMKIFNDPKMGLANVIGVIRQALTQNEQRVREEVYTNANELLLKAIDVCGAVDEQAIEKLAGLRLQLQALKNNK